MLRIVTWNIGRRKDPWRCLLDSDYDVALVQEAAEPPRDVIRALDVDPSPWRTAGEVHRPWRTAVVKLSDRVGVQWLEVKSIEAARAGDLAVSRPGTLATAVLTPSTGKPITVASIYAPWEKPHSMANSNWIFADASAHRLVSDLSVLIGRQAGHRILVAGDLNILHGYGEKGSAYWAGRYATVFARMSSLGLSCVGPQAPAGRLADPWPDELPRESRNVPTYHTSHQAPATATRQLDFVFASAGLAEQVRVRARNDPGDWGPSDHCRVEIEIK